MCLLSNFRHILLFLTLWTVSHQAPMSMGFSRQEYWSGLPFPTLWDLPDPGIEPGKPLRVSKRKQILPPGSPQVPSPYLWSWWGNQPPPQGLTEALRQQAQSWALPWASWGTACKEWDHFLLGLLPGIQANIVFGETGSSPKLEETDSEVCLY